MAEIERPTHKAMYENNQGLSPITLNGIEFTDFSTFSKLPWQYVAKSQTNAQTPGELKRKLAAAPRNGLDDINHFLDMLQVNWNGATIEKANIENGNTKIISSTPEFLAVFQSLCIKIYDNLVKLNKTLSNGKVDLNNKLTTGGQTYDTLPQLADLLNIIAGYVYSELEKDKTLSNGKVSNGKLTTGGTTIKNVNDLSSIVNVIAGYVYSELEKNKTVTKGTYSGTTLSGTDKTDVKNVADLCGLLGVICTYVYANLENNKTITKGKVVSGKLAGSDITTIKNVPDLCSLLGVLCTYIYNELEAAKTITKGNYRSSGADATIKDLSDLCQDSPKVLSNLCEDFYNYVYEPKNRTGAIKNSFVITTPCGKDFSSDTAADKTALMPFTGIKDGEIYDVIFYNDSSADHTITIKNKAALTNLPSGCTIRVPDGEMIEADCPKGGYVEINYMRVGNIIWVRNA